MATLDDFKKLEFKIALIKEAKAHSNADRLYVLKIDLDGEERQVVAGIVKSYSAEELVGKRVVVVANLETATIRGEESQGMILAASTEEGPILLSPEREVPVGSLVG